jgi:hypothetical protein
MAGPRPRGGAKACFFSKKKARKGRERNALDKGRMGIPIREHRDRELDGKGKRKASSYKNSYIQVRCSDQVGGDATT